MAEDKGFLNRITGEIVFLHENEGDTEAIFGHDAAIDTVFDRGRMDASPEDWLEIPKYDRRFDGENNEEAFVQDS